MEWDGKSPIKGNIRWKRGAHFYQKYHLKNEKNKRMNWAKRKPTWTHANKKKRLPHLLGFLASFKNHSSSRHNPTHNSQLTTHNHWTTKTTHRQWHKLCQKRLALSLKAAAPKLAVKKLRKREHFESICPPLNRLFGIPFFYVFFRNPRCPLAHSSVYKLWRLTKEAANNSSFCLQTSEHFLCQCRWQILLLRWYEAKLALSPPSSFPPPYFQLWLNTAPSAEKQKNIIWNGLSSILCAILLLFPFVFWSFFFASIFLFALCF